MQRIDLQELAPARRLMLTLLLCLLASALKFIVAWQTHSLTILADAAYSLLAICVHLTALLALWLEVRPDLPGDTLSARKLQTSIVLLLTTLLALTTWEIIGTIYEHYMRPTTPPVFSWTAPVALGTTALSQGLWSWLLDRSWEGRLRTLAREISRLQPVLTALGLLVLYLPSAWPTLDCIGAAVILILLTWGVIQLVKHSLNALSER